MKQVINGKEYNTDTADLVADFDNGYPVSDFHHFSEALYKTKKGQFFIAGEGGALTPYASSHGSSKGYGASLRLVTESEALEWCEEAKINPDTIKEHFNIEEG